MDYIPDYSDKNFVGPRSIFASILYFILACFNYFLGLVYFIIIRQLYTNHANIISILICCFICYNLLPICTFIYFYFIIHFNITEFNNENKIYFCIIFILLFVLIAILELLFKRYRKWYTKHFNLDGRLEEHEFPIFFLKEKKIY